MGASPDDEALSPLGEIETSMVLKFIPRVLDAIYYGGNGTTNEMVNACIYIYRYI